MKKNSRIKIILDTELFDKIKKQAEENGISISELCRQKIREPFPIQKIEYLFEELGKKLNIQLNDERRLK